MKISPINSTKPVSDLNAAGLVHSSQTEMHPRLENIVRRHINTIWSEPLHQPSVESFNQLLCHSEFSSTTPFILDSGCGTGKSTQALAGKSPDHLVIGVDRSFARLAKSGLKDKLLQRENYFLIRAELTTIWRLLIQHGYSPEKHFLFYPNPYPKPGHFKRRWHGHPVFPDLLALGGDIELRSNWEIYALEFAQAVTLVCGQTVAPELIQTDIVSSPFEKKYTERGQALFSVKVPASVTDMLGRVSQSE